MTRLDTGWLVPDANVWTGELIPHRLVFAWDDGMQDVRLSYLDPAVNDDRMFEVLWAQHGQDRSGHHKWRGVNALRQRAMMLEHRCMVCSKPAAVDGRVPWLFHTEPEQIVGGELLTNLPPTCRDCIPEALETCPPLRRHSRFCTAGGSRPYGVEADLYSPGDDETAVRVKRDVAVPLVSPFLRFALAKQLWVALEDVQDAPLP